MQGSDREKCREIVEEHWRTFLTFAASGATELGKECIARFERDIENAASTMSPEDAAIFIQAFDEERDAIHAEYLRSPEKLKARLGVAQPALQDVRGRYPLSLGEVATRTVVRATIWESVKSIFRAFR